MVAVGFIIMLSSLAAGLVAMWGLLLGRVPWARIANRRQAGLAVGGSLFAFLLGGIVIGTSAEPVAASAPAPTVTVTATVTVTPTPTPAEEPPAEDPPVEPATSNIQQFAPVTGANTQADQPVAKATQPAATKAPAAAKATQPAAAKSTSGSSVYYKNCTAARAAGAAPIYRGQPGYASHLDRDNEGIACE